MLHAVSVWLGRTAVSGWIQETAWVIPTIQSVHIVAIAAVMSAVLLLDLRLAGVVGANDSVARFTHRYLPWIWWGALALLLTGAVLVVGEPERSLENLTFIIKMGLVLAVVGITLVIQRPIRTDALYWESHERRVVVRSLAWLSLAVWVAIVCCGRMIAYTTG